MGEKGNLLNVLEIVMASSDKATSRKNTIMIKAGKLRKIAPKVYTTNMVDDPIVIVKRNLFYILGQLFPQAVISHRSAFEFKPTQSGDIFITYSYTKNINLPGVKVHILEGPMGTQHDMPFIENLFVSSSERRILENLQIGRSSKSTSSKCLERGYIEEQLEKILQVNGEAGLNAFRDKARVIADELGMQSEFKTLNSLVSALLTSKPAYLLTSPMAVARANGIPYDGDRIKLFELLFQSLQNEVFEDIDEPNQTSSEFRNFAFFESYFSNYIEGTEFEIEEAREIIETGQPMPARNADSHDVLGTFQIVASRREMQRVPKTGEELIDILQNRHRVMMAARPDRNPGLFKLKNNHAGETYFVDFTLVRGTLLKGFEYYQALQSPFAKALFVLFMISEVHPFEDGNGRISRIMMNAELVHADQSKIIIPTVFREDYLNALRRLTRKNDPSVIIRAMSRVRKFSANIMGDDFQTSKDYLDRCNAFKDGDGYILRF